MGLDDLFREFINECRDYIKERQYPEEIVEKAEIIFDVMHCYIMEAWNPVDFPENINKYRRILKNSLEMRIDMREKLLEDNDECDNPEFMKSLTKEKEKLKQVLKQLKVLEEKRIDKMCDEIAELGI